MIDHLHPPYARGGPWRVRLARVALRVLGVEVRVATRWATIEWGGSPPDDWPWDDGLAGVSFAVSGPHARVEAEPMLYARTLEDWRDERRIDAAVRELTR